MKPRRYGWKPDVPDFRDHRFELANRTVGLMAPKIDLRPECPPVYDQGETSSCTANAIAGAIEFDRKRQKLADFTPSRLFIYYNERALEGTVEFDAGARIRDGVKSVASLGACDEKFWPYVEKKFAKKPPADAYEAAKLHPAVKYQRLTQVAMVLRGCLAQGTPFVAGISVYESFESEEVAKTGLVPVPGRDEKLLGGHAVLVVGYDTPRARFIVRNSWGPGWGQDGYCEIPYSYLQNEHLAADFWAIQVVQ